MPDINIHTRIENVISNVIDPPHPWDCIIVVGDSRAAMNINSRLLSSKECAATNYGYPAFSLAIGEYLLNEVSLPEKPADTIVLVTSKNLFMGGPMDVVTLPVLLGLRGRSAFEDAIWSIRPIRRALIGMIRSGLFLKTLIQPSYKLPDGPKWSAELGRWSSDVTEGRVFPRTANFSSELNAYVEDFYRRDIRSDFGTVQQQLNSFIAAIASRTKRIVIILPPSYPDVEALAQIVSPSKFAQFRNDVRSAAKRLGIPLIDCSTAYACGLAREDFADTVHLNADGAKSFSQFIAKRLMMIKLQ